MRNAFASPQISLTYLVWIVLFVFILCAENTLGSILSANPKYIQQYYLLQHPYCPLHPQNIFSCKCKFVLFEYLPISPTSKPTGNIILLSVSVSLTLFIYLFI